MRPQARSFIPLENVVSVLMVFGLAHAIVQTQALWTTAAFCTNREMKRGKPHSGGKTRFRVEGSRASSISYFQPSEISEIKELEQVELNWG